MNAQSPSKRFTRGIQLHGKNSVEQPSFSLDLTQDFGEVAEFTRIQYAALLWNYGVQKIQDDATSDNEAPERPIRIHRDCDSSERITIN
ncbi:hypothetical protein H5410_008345 [Solanum commersonii]|uniref:Uncharacterized protein n=1 Tax=Solanum commersonii TaxID=4109 RepID=A0A9J6AGI6_SOLCO|nr:hypothetical protein H5410_008345 [Solanum commersonii]